MGLLRAARKALEEMKRVNAAGIFEGELNEAITALSKAIEQTEQSARLARKKMKQSERHKIFEDSQKAAFTALRNAIEQADRLEPLTGETLLKMWVESPGYLRGIEWKNEAR